MSAAVLHLNLTNGRTNNELIMNIATSEPADHRHVELPVRPPPPLPAAVARPGLPAAAAAAADTLLASGRAETGGESMAA